MATAQNRKRGFFLTMMALAILSFMLLTVQVWEQAFEQSDIRASQRFKGESLRLVLATVSDKSFSDFANQSAFFAVYKLASYTSVDGQALCKSAGASDRTCAYDNDINNTGTGKVNKTAYELIYHGQSEIGAGKFLQYADDENATYTFGSWQAKIRKAAEMMGFNATFSNITKFNLTQPDPWHVSIYFEVQMNISDFGRTMKQSTALHANSTFSINGFLDPMVSRNDMRQRNPPPIRSAAEEKQIWKNPGYNTPYDVSPRLIGNQRGDHDSRLASGITAYEGIGWFSGYLTSMFPDDPFFQAHPQDTINLSQYILVGDLAGPDAQKILDNRLAYGAIIITNRPVDVRTDDGDCTLVQQTKCLNCLQWRESRGVPGASCDGTKELRPDPDDYSTQIPGTTDYVPVLVTAGGFSSMLGTIHRGEMGPLLSDQQFVLLDSKAATPQQQLEGYHALWDTNALRDMATCGFYVAPGSSPWADSPTQPGAAIAPSFFQRMIAGVETDPALRSRKQGIESFVLGKWAGGADDVAHDPLSRLDWEFYGGTAQGPIIKSMPGCKSVAMCSAPASGDDKVVTEGVGRFKLSNDASGPYNATARYGIGGYDPPSEYKNLWCGATGTSSCTSSGGP